MDRREGWSENTPSLLRMDRPERWSESTSSLLTLSSQVQGRIAKNPEQEVKQGRFFARPHFFALTYLVVQLVKKLPEFYGTRRFITVLTSARHLSLS